MPWRAAGTELESDPSYSPREALRGLCSSLTPGCPPIPPAQPPTPRPLTSDEGALLPSLLQQQHVLQ